MRILIVDDHVLIRECLCNLLEKQTDIDVVGVASNGEEAIALVKELNPDTILMDIAMPVMDGREAIRRIKRDNPEVKILVLTMHEGDEYFFETLSAGASGYFIKGGSPSELIEALHIVDQGNVFLYPTMANKLLTAYLNRVKSGQERESYGGLTNREVEILKLVAEGNSDRDIAAQLFLSPATIQTHRANIMAKLKLHNRSDLVKYAIKQGLIQLDRDN